MASYRNSTVPLRRSVPPAPRGPLFVLALCFDGKIGKQIISMAQTENKQGRQASESRVLESTAARPDYNTAVKLVQAATQQARKRG